MKENTGIKDRERERENQIKRGSIEGSELGGRWL